MGRWWGGGGGGGGIFDEGDIYDGFQWQQVKDSEIMIIVYKSPHLSAEMVPLLISFCEKFIGHPEIWYEAMEK